MMDEIKNIVMLSDGTGNSSGKLQRTNVWRLYDALELPHPASPRGPKQIAQYDDGVGSSSFLPLALVGGVFGFGLKRNVLHLYMFLCRNYREGDRIYAFGFSRGAFTIRVLIGFLNDQGLVKGARQLAPAELTRLATDAFRRYRRKHVIFGVIHRPGRSARHSEKPIDSFIKSPPITFVGLWDTVAAYGLPFDELTRAWNFVFPLSVPDRNLCPNVERACHVLALNEERLTFRPVLWNEDGLANQPDEAKDIKEERLSQVWFAGVHSNVGGGYPDDGLANVSLHWMMTQAERVGLRFNNAALNGIAAASDIHDKIYNPRQGVGGVYRYQPRKVSLLSDDVNPRNPHDRVVIKRPKIHESVFQRIADGTDAYAPIGLPPHYAVVTASGAIQNMPAAVVPHSVIEGDEAAVERTNRQEKVWDIAWWRRGFYTASVFTGLFLLIFPVLYPSTLTCQQPLCSLSPAIEGLGLVLPDMLKPWLSAYSSHPLQFLLSLALGIVLLVIGGRLENAIKGKMLQIWQRSPSAPAAAHSALYRLRSSSGYRSFWKHIKWWVTPAIVALPVVWLVFAMISQFMFSAMNSAGWVCHPTDAAQLKQDRLIDAPFDPSDVCWASGVKLREGIRYQVVLSVPPTEAWSDAGIKTGISGFARDKMTRLMWLGLPFRRYLGEQWYAPIARIGSKGADEYPLKPGDILVGDPDRTLITEITARRSDELFLFVNDAVFPAPNNLQAAYRNNQGRAKVTILPVRENPTKREAPANSQ